MFGVLGAGLSSTFADDFNRADDTDVSTVQQQWVEVGPWEIASNRVRRTGDPGADTLNLIYRPTIVTDGFAECVPLSFLTGPVVRWDTTLFIGYMVYHNGDATRMIRFNSSAPSITELATSDDVPDLATDSLAIEAVGTSIRAYLNGSLIIEASDASWTSGVRGILTLDDTNQVEADNYAEGE